MCFFLGGLSVKITAKLFCIIDFLSEAEDGKIFLKASKKIANSDQDVYVNFISLQSDHLQSVVKEIFLERRLSLCKTAKGKVQILNYSENGHDLMWSLTANVNFSCFTYSLSEKAIDYIYIYNLLINRFFFQHTFINHHGLIIHAAGGSIHGKGMVFPAVSGTGKSTLSHLLLPFPENQLYSEERIIMRRLDDGWHLWGTPWKGSGVIARNESAPLNALVFLSQAPETKITPLSTSAALRRLLETVSIPWYSQEWTDKGLAVCESLLRDIPAYELAFRPDETAVQAVADFAASLP